ncbi:hypothetical protein GCM10017559_43170 [Streptosporangium longisporum]|uniref:Alpha-L-arabinofuranosidase C-terminal domain-containing protein n=1 Tax=Streptosporangium longisporum TaxID=46187 RepID=A0ABP6KMW2_9ACTN
MTDAVVVGSLLITLLRNADRVGVACQAQLANVIAPIRTEPGGPAWRQSIFHPFALTARHARGQVLRVEPECETIPTARYGEAPAIWATATHGRGDRRAGAVVVNRDRNGPCALELTLPDGLRPVEHMELTTTTCRGQHRRRARPRHAQAGRGRAPGGPPRLPEPSTRFVETSSASHLQE